MTKNWKRPRCPSLGEWVKNYCIIHRIEKKLPINTYNNMMDFKIIILIKSSQTQEYRLVFPFM